MSVTWNYLQVLSSRSRSYAGLLVKNSISFLQTGSYDFHQMRQLNHLRTSCLAREAIADHYRALQDPSSEGCERG